MTVKVRGKDTLFKQLNQTVPAIDAEVRKALGEAGDEMVDKVQSLVPVDSGDLRISARWEYTKATQSDSSRSPAIVVQAGADSPMDDAFYARWVEFGTPTTRKQPYFFPSYRLLKRKLKGRITRSMSKAIKKAGF